MSWKDWLFIPKADRTVIIVLLAVIVAVGGVYLYITIFQRQKEAIDLSTMLSEEHIEWQNKLIAKENDKESIDLIEKGFYTTSYTSKMKIGEAIELNSADTSALKTIPGIGSSYANRIVKYRNALGGYADIEQLNEVWGMDTYLFSQIKPYITLTPKHDSLYINRDSFEKLVNHPYLNYKQTEAIVDIRSRKSPIKSMKRLALLEEFKARDIERLSLYISFR